MSATTRPATPPAPSRRGWSSAATISSAALIMVAVFAVFAGTGTPSIKEIGVGLSVAIALDATLVRLILVPATMEIMGRWNWWLPERVARVLPRADFDSAAEPAREPASFGELQGAASRPVSSPASSSIGIRTCSSVSRSRRVTVRSSIVWPSTVTPQGVPISSWRR